MPLTIAAAAKQIAARTLSPVELAQERLARAEALNSTIWAFIRITPEPALAAAKAAEARQMSGSLKGPLDGIPFAHKDIYCTAGIPTTAHSAQFIDHVPAEDATTVKWLADAGVVSLGKLATHEFAFGGPSFDLPWPPAHNPWNPKHFTAGSSSGTGAAVSAGIIMGGTGSDTGGSIRGPSALCGIAGIKPTYGLCPRTGILPLAQSLDHAGPMARTAEDCALLLQAMAGHDPADPASAKVEIPDYAAALNQGVKGKTIGVIRHFHEVDNPVSPATLAGIERAIAALKEAGAIIKDVTLPSLQEFNNAGWVILMAEAYSVHETRMQTAPEKFGEGLRHRLAFGGLVTGADYIAAQKRRLELIARTQAATEGCDLLITAVAPGEAPPIDKVPKWAMLEKPGFTIPGNILGWPAMSVFTGLGAGELPVAAQIIGKPFDDAGVLAAGHLLEKALGTLELAPGI
ncbi:amidase [Rhodovarius crocodyli]|uniref:Amidase n=1 Tax=Rhodovarius crocodyli TaxID=1979269 RepID=A0A437MDE9_9PROT|nr:amidase [Rhodovarius crocodyli]RVT95616.1 amidase [Rhodovarius crocodyli]